MRFANLRRFDGGLMNIGIVGVGQEPLNAIRYGQNIRCRSGAIEERPGIIDYCDFTGTSFAGSDVQALYKYTRESYDDVAGDFWKVIVFSVGTDLYYVEPEDGPDVPAKINGAVALANNDIYCVNIYDHLFVANGEDDIMIWDGNNWYLAQMAVPTAPTLNAVNCPDNDFARKYKYTYYRDHSSSPYIKESEFSEVLTVDDADDTLPDIDIDYTQATDAQVTHYKFYATEWYDQTGDAPTDFFLIKTITLAEGVTAGHVFNDTIINVTTAADTTPRDQPPTFKYMLWHDNRIFGAGEKANPSLLYYSVIGKPFYWDTTNFWDEVSRDDGDVITGLAAIGTTRFIFKTHSIWEWTGDPEAISPIRPVERADASMNMTRLGIGCADPRSIALWSNSIIFRAFDGHVYMLTMDDLIQLSRYVETDIQSLGTGSRAAVFDDYYIIADGTKTMVCDLRRRQFGWEGFDTNIDPNCFLIDYNGYLLGSEGDKIIRYYTGTLDNNATFQKKFQTCYYEASGSDKEALFRRILARCRRRASDFTMIAYSEAASIATGTYATTDRFFSVARSNRADYLSAHFTWTGTGTFINGVSFGYLLVARHAVRGII